MLSRENKNTITQIDIQKIQLMDIDTLEELAKPASHRHFEIIWICNGSGNCMIDLEKFEIENNMIFCIKPGQAHQLLTVGDIDGYVISFSESFFYKGEQEEDLLCLSGLNQSVPKLTCISIQESFLYDMKEIVEKMTKEFDTDCLFRIEMLRRYLKIFFLYVVRQYEDSFVEILQTRNIEMVEKFKTLLDKNFITKKLVAEYADMLFVTPNYLNTVVKKMTGYSARHHIKQRIVLEAKRKATYSGLCMKEIAYYLGFMDISHFSKYFKNATGVNFSDFKRERYLMQIAG